MADEFYAFFLIFDYHDFTEMLDVLKDNNRAPLAPAVDIRCVVKHFKLTKSRKSPGPDNICGQVLKACV